MQPPEQPDAENNAPQPITTDPFSANVAPGANASGGSLNDAVRFQGNFEQTNNTNVQPTLREAIDKALEHPLLRNLQDYEKFVFEKAQNALLVFLELPDEISYNKRIEHEKKQKGSFSLPPAPLPFKHYLKQFKEADLSLERYIAQVRDEQEKKVVQLIYSFSQELGETASLLEYWQTPNALKTSGRLESPETWAFFLLEQKAFGQALTPVAEDITNLFRYLQDPENSVLIANPADRRLMSIHWLKKPFTVSEFDEAFINWFSAFSIVCNNSKNNTLLYSLLPFDEGVQQFWNFPETLGNTGSKLTQYLTNFSPDNLNDVRDPLGITADVEALAALIAFRNLQPPLAIGLFGHWGSGKSFFMRRLQERIRLLEQAARKSGAQSGFCREVVQVEFNAWHYSDANIWANLMVTIFEQLQRHVAPTAGTDERHQLLEAFTFAGEAIAAQRAELAQLNSEIEAQQNALLEQQVANDKKARELATLQPADLWKTLPDTQRAAIEQQLADASKKLGIDEAQLAVGNLRQFAQEVKRLRGRVGYLLDRFVNSPWQQKALFGLLLLAPVAVVVWLRFGKDVKWLYGLKGYLATFVSASTLFLGWATPKLRNLNTQLGHLEAAQRTVDELVAQKRAELQANENVLRDELASLKAQHEAATQRLLEAQQRKAQLEIEIANYNPRRQLADFIGNRSGSKDYQQHLGLIALIRSDLERLSNLLRKNREQQPETLTELEKEQLAKLPGVERIVLYIDDLDRCPTDRVKQVLEAIHLLLALDLFVVVVGVDARWVTQALLIENAKQLRDDERAGTRHVATPYDYLEKIFQIPLLLKPMNNNGTKELLSILLENETEKQEQKAEQKAPSKSGSTTSEPLPLTPSPVNDVPKEIPTPVQPVVPEPLLNKPTSQQPADDDSLMALELPKNKLHISDNELAFIHTISPLVGHTPRAAKRFVNLYRLLRVHDGLPDYALGTHDDYLAILLLLALVNGGGDQATVLTARIQQSAATTLSGFIDELKADQQLTNDQHLNRIIAQLGAIETSVQMDKLKAYLPFVSRFSFRTLGL